MMQYIRLVVALVAGAIVTGCTQNNGNIGDWFGEWHLESITVNDVDDDAYTGDVLWKFQNDIVEMVVVNAVGHSHSEHYGTWSSDDATLILNFTHHDDLHPAGSSKYAPPAQTMLPAAVTQLKILRLSSKEMVLRYDPAEDKSIVYLLKKRG